MRRMDGTWRSRRPIRLAAEAYRTGDPFHLTICAAPGVVPFELPCNAGAVTRILDPQLRPRAGPVQAYCVMPDHVHTLLIGSPDVVAWACGVKARITTALRRFGWQGPVWQRSFCDRCLRDLSGEGLARVARYIAENPVRRGLSARVEDWPYWRIADGVG